MNNRTTPSNQIIFGIRAVIEAIKANKEVDKVLIQHGLQGELFYQLMTLLKEKNIPYQKVPVERLFKLNKKNHQGVAAFLCEITYCKIEPLISSIFEKGEDPFILLLDRITDVRNFGAIARTAECAGVHAIIIPSRGAAQINADAIKTSAGALYKIPICRENNLKETIQFLKDSGLSVIGCTEKTNTLLYQTPLKGPICIIMGSEENGISGEYLKACDYKSKIPMFGSIESLNVSVSTGIILYEAIRQRLQ
jgi:23S rRNA (guanosine2251-2'-O)-methyltransferase